MIAHESSFRSWLHKRGVGARDRVASSPASYISYLTSVSGLLGEDITPELVSSEADVQAVLDRVQGRRAPNTIRNYGSALRQYAGMVQARAHP